MTSNAQTLLNRLERLTGARDQGMFVKLHPFGRGAATQPEDIACAYRLAGWQPNTLRR